MESPATGGSSWTTTGSTCGPVALENPQCRLLPRNYAVCRGAWGATSPKVASLRKELPHAADGGPEGTLAGVARWVGETETSFRESVPRRRKETPMSATLTAAQPGRAGLPQPDLLPRVGKGGHFAAWEEPELFSEELW